LIRESIQRIDEQLFKIQASLRAKNKQQFNEDITKASKTAHAEEGLEQMRRRVIEGHYGLKFDNSGHLNLIREAYKFGQYLFRKKCLIRYVPDNKNWKFITSDVPVIEIWPKQGTVYGSHFFQRRHIFALSPKILLEYYSPHEPGKVVKRKQVRSLDEVDEMNMLRLSHSYEYAYSAEQVDFLFATNFIRMREKISTMNILASVPRSSNAPQYFAASFDLNVWNKINGV
jgi:hypothetical protein